LLHLQLLHRTNATAAHRFLAPRPPIGRTGRFRYDRSAAGKPVCRTGIRSSCARPTGSLRNGTSRVKTFVPACGSPRHAGRTSADRLTPRRRLAGSGRRNRRFAPALPSVRPVAAGWEAADGCAKGPSALASRAEGLPRPARYPRAGGSGGEGRVSAQPAAGAVIGPRLAIAVLAGLLV